MLLVLEKNPPKQGLKHAAELRLIGDGHVVLEKNPPKQGLKRIEVKGEGTRVTVLEKNPPKQGLKQK